MTYRDAMRKVRRYESLLRRLVEAMHGQWPKPLPVDLLEDMDKALSED